MRGRIPILRRGWSPACQRTGGQNTPGGRPAEGSASDLPGWRQGGPPAEARRPRRGRPCVQEQPGDRGPEESGRRCVPSMTAWRSRACCFSTLRKTRGRDGSKLLAWRPFVGLGVVRPMLSPCSLTAVIVRFLPRYPGCPGSLSIGFQVRWNVLMSDTYWKLRLVVLARPRNTLNIESCSRKVITVPEFRASTSCRSPRTTAAAVCCRATVSARLGPSPGMLKDCTRYWASNLGHLRSYIRGQRCKRIEVCCLAVGVQGEQAPRLPRMRDLTKQDLETLIAFEHRNIFPVLGYSRSEEATEDTVLLYPLAGAQCLKAALKSAEIAPKLDWASRILDYCYYYHGVSGFPCYDSDVKPSMRQAPH